MYCRSCGAELAETDHQCPYCGTWTVEGAQKEYMNRLEEIREDTEELHEAPRQVWLSHLRSHGHFAWKIACAVAAVCLVCVLASVGFRHYLDAMDRRDVQKETAFRQTYFPKLEEIYASGDDRAVYEYIHELYGEEGSGALYYWEHAAYYDYYGRMAEMEAFTEARAAGESVEHDEAWILYTALSLACDGIEDWDRERMTRAEVETVETYIAYADTLLAEVFGIGAGDRAAAYEACCDDGYLSYERCRKYLERK